MPLTDDRMKQIKDELYAHRRDSIGAFIGELERTPPRPLGKGYVSIEYAMFGAVAYYMGDDQIIVYPLELSERPLNIQESVRLHLGAENWNTWERLKAEVNSHLDAVSELWKGIEESLAAEARSAGLFPSSTPAEGPVDTYWPALFVATVWREPDYYDANKVHSWERAKIVEDTVMIPMRHTVDAARTFVFADSNMLRSQSLEPVMMMKKAWEVEATRVGPIQKGLASELAEIKVRTSELLMILRRLQREFNEASVLSESCPRCQPLLNELNSAS